MYTRTKQTVLTPDCPTSLPYGWVKLGKPQVPTQTEVPLPGSAHPSQILLTKNTCGNLPHTLGTLGLAPAHSAV